MPLCKQVIEGREASAQAGLQVSRSTAYRLLRQVRSCGKAAFEDGRHGHPAKLRADERAWLETYCHTSPGTPSRVVQTVFQEREMFELDNRKDQVMTICKVALVNVVMWTRDQYFPLTYAHATWKRLAPFFHLPGRVTQGPRAISVELRPFNDHQLNHDLVALCERVNQASPQLPDGRQLLFSVSPVFDRQQRRPDSTPSRTKES